MDSLSNYSYLVIQGPDSSMCCLPDGPSAFYDHITISFTLYSANTIHRNWCQYRTADSCSCMICGHVALSQPNEHMMERQEESLLSINPLLLGKELKGKRRSNVREPER